MEINLNSSEDPKEIILKAIDPRHKTPFERSNTAFISIGQVNGSISLSAFLARLMGIVAGDRIMFIKSPSNNLIWLITKTTQREKTKPIKITGGVYKINSKKLVSDMAESFRFNPSYKGYIRLYVNTDRTIPLNNYGGATAFQLFDIPHMREDFETEEQREAYIAHINSNPYIIKK